MNSSQATAKRAASLLWFPFFFAAAFTVMGLLAYAHPQPHGLTVAVVSADEPVAARLAMLEDRGITVRDLPSIRGAQDQVTTGEVAAAYNGSIVYVASAASGTRASYIRATANAVVGPDAEVVDLRPLAPGDTSGVGLFFYALPNLLVGLITSIVLVQLGSWPMHRKLLALAATGAFASVFTYLFATAREVIPGDGLLIMYAFLLTQAIGWLTTAAAVFARQFFMPVSMTFVLIVGIPSSGATVNRDMLPAFIGFLSDWLPFAQFINLARASAYLGSGIARPLLVLSAWAALGAGLLVMAGFRDRRSRITTSDPPAPTASPDRAQFRRRTAGRRR
jgi:hypothetical protein